MWVDGKDFVDGLMLLLGLAAVVGWAVIEAILWLCRHIVIGWVS